MCVSMRQMCVETLTDRQAGRQAALSESKKAPVTLPKKLPEGGKGERKTIDSSLIPKKLLLPLLKRQHRLYVHTS